MIVVEGPDGAGKTTLIRELTSKLNVTVAPRVVSKEAEAMIDLKVWVERNVRAGFQSRLFDRHRLISEFIYGPVLHKTPATGFDDLGWVSEMMFRFYAARPFIIYCMPPLKVVQKNVADDPDNKVIRDVIPQLYTAYLHRIAMDMVWNHRNMLVYDYTTDELIPVIGAVRSILEGMADDNHPHR